ncbi:ABC-2 type transporter-domain-containing protein [Desarmillaria tabescens]|uniref:ABC-2 type transporter-domain-containing protein n=1 Tax=Armillaria tabescens TaxID=1929756 RepID=A0AA39JIT5_ARMTA|nr:ABC-2 type transporter-domain-containing protein [Desarmillaria tabescens]KAK0441238.1 ABC-2 type transporter-domain-containing protein [Desarmillaria tabescens]
MIVRHFRLQTIKSSRWSRQMQSASRSKPIEFGNPFQGSKDLQLDPHSEHFNYQSWIRSVLSITSRDPDRYPQRTAGISFRNLNVFGYGKSTDHQKTVGNILLDIPRLIAELLGSKGRRIDILRDFEGVLRAGEMLVVLGRPGSGCTTLLKTISGETHGFWVEKSAKINYQGIPWKTMHRDFRGEVVYNAETDVHFPNLTVGETLSFAAQARMPRTRLPGISRDMWAEHMKDVVMTVFGLTHTVNTRVGNDFIRGVSGGERKRVSIAEVALSGCPLQCWDNSTRGLDSATALEFVKTVRLSTTYMGATAVVAIYQASQTIYDIFDKAVVLYEGRQIYFGRTDDAKRFFVDMGFHCPERQTTADFLTSLTNPAERKIRPGFESKVPRTPDEFARAWKESAERKLLLEDIDQFDGEFPIGGNQLAMFRKARRSQQARGVPSHSPYTLSTPMQVRLCLVRGFQRLRGDMSLALTTIFGNFIMALIISSIFYNLPHNTASFYSRGALLFFAILLNAFSSALEILTLWVQRPIVEKHSRMAFYRPLSEAISSIICDLPQKVITSISFNLVLYFMTNLRRTVDGFFIFLLFSFMCTLAMSMIFRTIGALSRTISQAMAPASLLMLSLVIYTGFTIPTSGMKAWFRWINYLDPIGYAFESLMVNEFAGQEYPCSVYLPTGPDYTNVSAYEHVCATTGARAGSDVVYGSNYLSDSFKYSRAHLWRNLGIVIGFICFFFATYITATECVTAAKSKGEVLVFRRGHLPHKMKEVDDEESTSDPHLEAKLSLHRTVTFQDRAVSAIQKQTAVFHWEDVCYDISIKGEPRRLLNNANGWVEPGTLTALVGASGAGKTTLLDVLASRITMGVVSGSMLVDGHHRDSSFQRKTGYVQQQDLHLETSTVREALVFSAMLRQLQHISKADKVAYVEEVIRLLEMELYADAVVGVPGEGLNVEQRKRLTIGVELAAKPELLLFLDEPTSGLDSQTAWSICTLLRKLAKNGQAILCTIHQPSALLFQEFDRLLFLAEGGQTVYFGDIGKNSDTLIHYFERNGAPPCPPDANPAEWILDVIGAAPGAVAVKDFVKVWNESPELIAIKTELARKRENVKPIYSNVAVDNNSLRPFATPSWYQYIICTHRVFQQYWRTPSYIYSKLILGMLTALFIGFSFYKADNTLQGLQNQMFSIFMLMIIFGNVVNQTMPHFVTQRSLYEVRERPAKVYSWQAFMLANITAELPWNTLMGALIFFCYYYPVGMQRNAHETNTVTERGALFFLFVWSFLMFTSTFTDMVIAGIEVAETGGNIAIMLFSLTLLFCSVLAGPNDFSHFWIFMYRVSPFTYLVDGMMSTGLANAAATCSTVEISVFNPANGTTCGEYMKSYIALAGGTVLNPDATSDCRFCSITSTNVFLTKVNSAYSHRWRNLGIYWVYILFNIIGALFLYWLARVPKGAKARNI